MRVSFLDLELKAPFCYLWIVFKTGAQETRTKTIAIVWGKMSRAIYN